MLTDHAAVVQRYAEAKADHEIALYRLQTARILLDAMIYYRRMNGERAKDIAADLHLTPQFVVQAFDKERRKVSITAGQPGGDITSIKLA